MGRTSRSLRTHWLLVAFLAVGVALRAAMTVSLPLPLMTFTDANVYVSAAREFIFRPVMGRTAGYPLILRVLHDVWATPIVPVIVQHVAVLAGAVALYAIARRCAVARVWAALAAGVWLVSIDWLWLEHQLLGEAFGTVLVVSAVAVFALAPERRSGRAAWVVAIVAALAAGVLAMGAGFVRPAMFPALPGIGLAALLLLRTGLWQRLAAAAVLVATCGALLYGYLLVQDDHTGFGMRLLGTELDMGGYPAVAPVADCRRFTPPPRTRSLCERTPTDQRPTRDWYYWDPNSPGRKLLATQRPEALPDLHKWAASAYAAHADDVRRDQLVSLQRLFGLGGLRRPLGEQDPEQVSLEIADVSPAPVVVTAIQAYYGVEDAPNRPASAPYGVLEDLQEPTRPPGLLLLLALVAGLVGAVAGLGPARRLVTVAVVAGWLPVLYATWTGGLFNWRYVLPGIPLIALAAFAAISALAARRASRRPAPTEPPVPDRDAVPA